MAPDITAWLPADLSADHLERIWLCWLVLGLLAADALFHRDPVSQQR